jgi:DNA helicase-2/ATP-dependent DNA helicase PcrA
VIAAAGSGKTRLLLDVLVSKIKNKKIDPTKEQVVVFTFTNNAADELSFRLTKLLGDQQDLLNQIFIGTIHGWCNDYLKKHGTSANTKVMDELEQYQLLLRIYPIMSLEQAYQKTNKFQKIEAFVKDLELFYNENLELDEKSVPSKIGKCISEYLSFIKDQRLLDFGSLIREAVRQLQSRDNHERYHLFVDEYQDVNLAQVMLFQALMNQDAESTLFAVGDPRQAIYQWRGGDLRRILNFSSDFKDAGIFTMEVNHRSREGIVRFANIVSEDMDFSSCVNFDLKLPDIIPTPKRKDQAVSVIHVHNNIAHEEQIVKEIIALHREGVEYSDIAILMRSVVNHSSELMNFLDQAGIPYYSPNKNAGIDFIQEFIGSVMRLMLLVDSHEPTNREEEEEREKEIAGNLESIKKYCQKGKANDIHLAVLDWYEQLSKPIAKAKRHKYYPNEAYNFRKQFFEFCNKVGFTLDKSNVELQEGFSAITQVMKSIEEVYRRRFRGGLSTLRASPIEVFLKNLKWQLEFQIERWAETGMEISSSGNRVTISTVHAAKGLEWPVVFVPFLWKNRFPLPLSRHGTSFPDHIAERYGTTVEDEKRLWYVAVTRTRDRLYFYSGSEDGKRNPSTFTYSEQMAHIPRTIETGTPIPSSKLSIVEHHDRKVYLKLGVSDFLLLTECPFHFYLRRIKLVDVPVSEKFGAGNVLHKVIERVLTEGENVDLDKTIDEEVYLPLAESFYENRVKKGVSKRTKALIKSGLLGKINLAEIPFHIIVKNFVVAGIIDALRECKDGVDIIDWKSSIHERFRTRYENQIRVYSEALRLSGYKVRKGLIYSLKEIVHNPENAMIEVDVSQRKTRELLKTAEINMMVLMKREFGSPQNSTPCNKCDVALVCKYSLADNLTEND